MATHSHKRDANARSKPRAAFVVGPIALLATASAVSLGVLTVNPPASDSILVQGATAAITNEPTRDREVLSRSEPRVEIERLPSKADLMLSGASTRKAIKNADTKLWTSTDLNLWTDPGEKAKQIGLIEAAKRVLVTGRNLFGRDEIVLDGKTRWITQGYLTADKPEVGIGGDCTNGSSVANGVSPNIVKVHQAVCAAFPEITTYGTFRADGEHSQGLAVDIMVSGSRGYEVADFIRANFAELGVSYIIYSQRIWSVERGGEGWRGMSDRGSVTANHQDHVHVTTY